MTTVNNDRHAEPLANRLVDAEILAWLDTHLGLLLAQTTEGSDAWKAVRQARYLNLSEFGTQLTPQLPGACPSVDRALEVDGPGVAMTPSERLVAAADLIRDLAAKASPAPWSAGSPMIEKWLRETAADVDAYGEYWIDAPGHVRNALAFAKAVLDSGVDTP
jgi:hypothetical protein